MLRGWVLGLAVEVVVVAQHAHHQYELVLNGRRCRPHRQGLPPKLGCRPGNFERYSPSTSRNCREGEAFAVSVTAPSKTSGSRNACISL